MIRRFDPRKVAEKLTAVRESDYRAETGEPPPCICEPISYGCKCGRFEYEMRLKNTQSTEINLRETAYFPQPGEVYIISRPPGSEIDYCTIPFKVWAKCEGKKAEIEDVEAHKSTESFWWCWIDVSALTKNNNDKYWFPSDALLKI